MPIDIARLRELAGLPVTEGLVANWMPIERFEKTDDDPQEQYLLKTESGVVYLGEWDPTSGYFFADAVVENPNNAREITE